MIANILLRKYPTAIPLRDYVVWSDHSGERLAGWNAELGPQPTSEQLTTWAAEPEQATWDAKHGGDLVLTFRRKAKEALDDVRDDTIALDRAIALTTLDEINLLWQWITNFKAAVAAATSLANLQTRVAALGDTPQRTATQLRTAIKQQITDGNADT